MVSKFEEIPNFLQSRTEQEKPSVEEILKNEETKAVIVELAAKKELERYQQEEGPEQEEGPSSINQTHKPGLAKRIIQGEVISSDQEAIQGLYQETLEIFKKVKELTNVLGRNNGRLIEEALSSSREFQEFKPLVFIQSLKEMLLDKGFYTWALIHQERKFNQIEQAISALSELNEKNKTHEECLKKFSERWGIAEAPFEEAFQTEDPREKEKKIGEILERYAPILGRKKSKQKKAFQKRASLIQDFKILDAGFEELRAKTRKAVTEIFAPIKEIIGQEENQDFQERITKTMNLGKTQLSQKPDLANLKKPLSEKGEIQRKEGFKDFLIEEATKTDQTVRNAFNDRERNPQFLQATFKRWWEDLPAQNQSKYQAAFLNTHHPEIMAGNDFVSWLIQLFLSESLEKTKF